MADRGKGTQTPGAMQRARVRSVSAGPPRHSALWLWTAVSIGLHVLLFIGFAGARGAGLFSGAGMRDGDGFGGDSVELEIAGPEEGAPVGSLSSGRQPEVEPIPELNAATQEPAEQAPALEGELPVRLPTPREHAAREHTADDEEGDADRDQEALDPPPARELAHRGDPTREERSAPGAAEEPSGTGGDDSTAGAPAGDARDLILGSAGMLGDTVTAQRALVPNGGVCGDPVAGTWRAQKFRASDHSWVRFVLRIHREGHELRGTITSRIWSGTPSNPEPGQCTAFGFDHTWVMQARGSVEGESVTFVSSHARLVRQDCPSSDHTYAPDRFTGTIRPLSETFQSRNNDGAFDIDEPYTFRRVSCE